MKNIIPNKQRKGLKDLWNSFMVKDISFTKNDIPVCKSEVTTFPKKLILWDEAKAIYKKYCCKNKSYKDDSFICFYMDDYKFDGERGIWHKPNQLLKVSKHFAGVITPDFSTYQDFPEPIKIFATYRMRAIGCWLGLNGVPIINNVRWGTRESFKYCFDGITKNQIIAIGTIGGSPRKIIDRNRFEVGLYEMIKRLKPKGIIVYGSAHYRCFQILQNEGIEIREYKSRTSIALSERGDKHE